MLNIKVRLIFYIYKAYKINPLGFKVVFKKIIFKIAFDF